MNPEGNFERAAAAQKSGAEGFCAFSGDFHRFAELLAFIRSPTAESADVSGPPAGRSKASDVAMQGFAVALAEFFHGLKDLPMMIVSPSSFRSPGMTGK